MKLDIKNKYTILKSDVKSKYKKLMLRKHGKLLLALAVVFIVLIVSFTSKAIFGSKPTITQNTATAKRGDLQILVTGSGPIYSTNESKLYSQINAKITKVNFKEGDVVKSGDVIAEFDDADFQSTLANNTNGLEQSQVSAGASYQDANNLTIRAPFSGQVSNITVNKGDTVQKGGAVLTISDTSKLKVLLTYNANDAQQIALGQSADVYLTSLMQSVSGTVTYKSNQPVTTSAGGLIYSVEIKMDNPGAILEGMTASADVNTYSGTVSSTNSAPVNYINKQTVTSLTGGTVQNISVNESQRVSSGAALIIMNNDDVTRARQAANLKVSASQNQLNTSLNQTSKYKITAPYDGVITKINFKVGDAVKPGDEVSDISNPDQMQFDVPVDELDVAKLVIGQKTNITLDAISSTSTTPMIGEVAKIAFVGTSISGVTTYPVTIKINDNADKLKGGMNANAEVIVNSMKDVLYVPIEAVTKVGEKSYIWVKGNGKTSVKKSSNSSSSQTASYYANSVKKEVKVGDNNATYIVILSGVNVGDVVILPQTKTSPTKTTSATGMGSGSSAGGAGFGGGGR